MSRKSVFDFPSRASATVEIQKCLLAILRLVDDLAAVRRPGDAHDQQISWMIFKGIDPTRGAARGVDDTKLDDRVWISRFRIRSHFELLVIRNVIDDGELRYRSVVDAKICNRGGIRTPPVRFKVSPSIKLFLVDPVEPAIQDL